MNLLYNVLLITTMLSCYHNGKGIDYYDNTVKFKCQYQQYACEPCAQYLVLDVYTPEFNFLKEKVIYLKNIDSILDTTDINITASFIVEGKVYKKRFKTEAFSKEETYKIEIIDIKKEN